MGATYPIQGGLCFIKRGSSAIARVKKIKPPAVMRKAIETTVLGSTWATFVKSSVVETDDCEIEMNFDPTDNTHIQGTTGASLYQDVVDAGLTNYGSTAFTILLGSTTPATPAGGLSLAFNAVVTKWAPGEATLGGIVPLSCTLKVDGAITITT